MSLTAYLPVLAYLGLWLLLGACLGLLRRALAGPSREPASSVPGGVEVESGDPCLPLARLAPAVSGAVLLLVLGAVELEAEPVADALLPFLLLVLVVAIALIHAGRRGTRSDPAEPP